MRRSASQLPLRRAPGASAAPSRLRGPSALPAPGRALAPLAALLLGACASLPAHPPPDVAARARALLAYSARLSVRLSAPELRARTPALVGFRRPDALRVEVPGPAGPRLVLVASGGRLTAVFPPERAFYSGGAGREELLALIGVDLTPEEVIDLLVGVASPRLRACTFGWGERLPRRIDAVLPDGGRLRLGIEDPEADPPLSSTAFAAPPHAGYRELSAAEARRLWAR
jgi:hypothetical protein